jgi:hypothetical protein
MLLLAAAAVARSQQCHQQLQPAAGNATSSFAQFGCSYQVCALVQLGEKNTPLADGWGLTTDGKSLIVSDGSHNLTWLDPETMQPQRTVPVMDGTQPIHWVNEVGGLLLFSTCFQDGRAGYLNAGACTGRAGQVIFACCTHVLRYGVCYGVGVCDTPMPSAL